MVIPNEQQSVDELDVKSELNKFVAMFKERLGEEEFERITEKESRWAGPSEKKLKAFLSDFARHQETYDSLPPETPLDERIQQLSGSISLFNKHVESEDSYGIQYTAITNLITYQFVDQLQQIVPFSPEVEYADSLLHTLSQHLANSFEFDSFGISAYLPAQAMSLVAREAPHKDASSFILETMAGMCTKYDVAFEEYMEQQNEGIKRLDMEEAIEDYKLDQLLDLYAEHGVDLARYGYRDVKDILNACQLTGYYSVYTTKSLPPILHRYKNEQTGEEKVGFFKRNDLPASFSLVPLIPDIDLETRAQLAEQCALERETRAKRADDMSFRNSLFLFQELYSFSASHREVLQALSKDGDLKTDKVASAELLSSMLHYYPYGCGSMYVKAFKDLGLEYAVPELLSTIRSPEATVLHKKAAAEILFDLELGEVKIEQNVAQMYGKLFKLTTVENQLDLLETIVGARRLSSDGRVAVLNANGAVSGYFDVTAEDLFGDTEVEKNVDFAIEQLLKESILRKADETPEDAQLRLEIFMEYLAHFSVEIDSLYERTGVMLNSLPVQEQAYFLHAFRKANTNGDGPLIEEVIKKYDIDALRVFSFMAYGGNYQDLLTFLSDENGDESLKQTLLASYAQMTTRAQNVRRLFELGEEASGVQFAAEVHEAFVRKSAEFLSAAILIEQGSAENIQVSDILEGLRQVNYSLVVLERFARDRSAFKLVEKPHTRIEYADPEGSSQITSYTYVLLDSMTGDRVAFSIRPYQTYNKGDAQGAGEARINFSVSNKLQGVKARLGFDLTDFHEPGHHVVSMDMGFGDKFQQSGIYPTQRLGKPLQAVLQSSEGGHNEGSFSLASAQQFSDIALGLIDYMNSNYQAPVGRVRKERISTLAPSL